MVRESADEINQTAAAWVVRMERDNDPIAAQALQDWLDGDRRRRGAYLRAQAIWRRVEVGSHRAVASVSEPAPAKPHRLSWRLFGGGIAAAAAAVAVLFFNIGGGTTYATHVGEQSREALADGSVIVLNTASASRVDLTPKAREVDLERGEALFEVAKDKERPFIVSAGPIRVEAVGTAFTVRRFEDGSRIVVTEGRVRAWSELNPGSFVSIDAGQQAFIPNAAGASAADTQSQGIDEALAWQRGMIAIDGMTLLEAATEFNRYNERHISVDERFAGTRMVGWFEARDVDGFARSAATIVGGRVSRGDGHIRITQ
mgnify:CR=1 FL=1